MRLHKKIERILKFRWEVHSNMQPGEGADQEFIEWIRSREEAATEIVQRELIDPLLEDPEVDAIAAENGLTADQLLDSINVIVLIMGMIKGEGERPDMLGAGTDARNNEIMMRIGAEYFAYDEVAQAYSALIHELGHVAENLAGLLPPEPPYKEGYAFMEWLTNPHELIAVRGQILDYINDGYTEEEIVQMMLGLRFDHIPPEMMPDAERLLREQIAMVQQEGPIRV